MVEKIKADSNAIEIEIKLTIDVGADDVCKPKLC